MSTRQKSGVVSFLFFLLVLYIGGMDIAAAGLADSPWPMFQHDLQHTGRSPYVGPVSPTPKWEFQVEGMPGSPAIGSDGTIYLPTGMLHKDTTGYLYAINPDGTQKWRYQFAGLPSSTTPAIAADGTIYVHMNGDEGNGGAIEKLYAINPDGSLKWVFKQNGIFGTFTSSVQSSPAIGWDGTIYVGSHVFLFAINPDGTIKWQVSPSSMISSPAIGNDGTIYFKDSGSDLWAYNLDGTQKWRVSLAQATGGDSSPSIGSDGTIYIASDFLPHAVHAVNPDGTIKWSYTIEDRPVSTPAIATDGTIYTCDNGLYALNPDGSLKWKFSEALFSSQSPVIDSEGTIYWRESWVFYAINPDGTQKWKLNVPAPAPGGVDPSPAIGSDGTLYIPMPDNFNPSNQYLKAYQGTTITYMLAVNVSNFGKGSGTVISNPPGINCGSDCSEAYEQGTSVTLTPIPDSGSQFVMWGAGGECMGPGTCTLTMDSDKTARALFNEQSPNYPQKLLTVIKSGKGSGTVTRNPAGTNFGSDSSWYYVPGTSVTLTPSPDAFSTFGGWSGGGCSGTGSCSITMDSDKTITATFDLKQYRLTVLNPGAGSGTVTSSPAGINCGSDCSESYDWGTAVTLTATAASGSIFGGWSGGGCSGTGICVVVMDADIEVTAAFSPPAVSVSPSSLDFGIVAVGKKITKTVKIANNGSKSLIINISGLEGTDFSIQGSSSVTIKAKKSYSLKVQCMPTPGGIKRAILEIQTSDPDTASLEISLTATLPATTPDISVGQTSIEFGNVKVGKKATKTIKITNNGTGDLWITFSGLEETGFSIQGSSSITIKAKKSYNLKVLFTPKTEGSETAILEIQSNDLDAPILEISLSGIGQ